VITINATSQDLTLDPDGELTVLTFSSSPPALVAGDFEADGGQNAITAIINGLTVTVTWDARVTPDDRVRVVGVPGVLGSWNSVTTTNAAAPTFSVVSASQVVGLGNDTISVQFAGARVIETQAEDLSNWSVEVNSATLDLTGSVFSLNPLTQVLSITTGANANLHASFDLIALDLHSVAATQLATTPVVGAATGDTTPPTLVSTVQNLAEDEFGRVVDVTFNEAMDPLFATAIGNFVPALPEIAILVEQPSPEILRVTFTGPAVPGLDTISLENLVDAHGNAFPTSLENVAQGSTVANFFTGTPVATTVANVGGDFVDAFFVQGLDPTTATDLAAWTLESPTGTNIPLAGGRVTYDVLTKKLHLFNLPSEILNGDSFLLRATPAAEPYDVDGELFTDIFNGTVAGEVDAPTIVTLVQNRFFDPTAQTIDVTMSEDLDQTTAETTGNWSVTGANVTLAELQPGLRMVRLTLDAPAIPGANTVSALNVRDLAGNAMAPAGPLAITTNDITAPSASSPVASAVEGANDDTLFVVFDDDMIQAEVEVPASWTAESPVGTPLDTSNASVTYDPISRTATMVFDGGDGINFKRDDDFNVAFVAMRDLGANTVTPDVLVGTITAESNLPALDSVWVETAFSNQVHVRFSEPCDHLDDLLGLTTYTVRDSGGTVKGTPATATVHADDLGAELVFGFAVVAASDTLDVGGLTDLAGNYMFPAITAAIEVEDAAEPALAGTSGGVTVSGEANDTITAVFDRRPSLWGLMNSANWTLAQGVTPVSLTNSTFSFDGALTVTIDFDRPTSPNLGTGLNYDLTVDNLMSAQGVAMSVASLDGFAATGDVVAPLLPAGRARLDAGSALDTVLVELDEALDPADAVNPLLIDINGTTNPDTTVAAGRRTVRAFFSGGVTTADTVNVNLRDLAGNPGVASQVVNVVDVAGPLVTSADGVAVANAGGDLVNIHFDQPLEPGSGLSAGNYTVTNGGNAVSLAGASIGYRSATNTVTIRLAAGNELLPGAGLVVTVDNVTNHGGLVINPPANIGGAVTGDLTAPAFSNAFANYREDAGGLVIDVRFDEDVDPFYANDLLSWSGSGGQSVLGVVTLDGRTFRLTLDLPLAGGETLDHLDLYDLAGNGTGPISFGPVL
jgi:hypothetical protein